MLRKTLVVAKLHILCPRVLLIGGSTIAGRRYGGSGSGRIRPLFVYFCAKFAVTCGKTLRKLHSLPRCDFLCAETFARGASAVFRSFKARKEFDSRFIWLFFVEFRSEDTKKWLNFMNVSHLMYTRTSPFSNS